MLAMRDRSDSAVESSELRVEELKLALDDAHEQILELTFERDAMDQATQKVNRVASQTERDIRIQLEHAIEENMKLRETTVAGEREKAERALSEVKRERAEIERLDAENAANSVCSGYANPRVHLSRGRAADDDLPLRHLA